MVFFLSLFHSFIVYTKPPKILDEPRIITVDCPSFQNGFAILGNKVIADLDFFQVIHIVLIWAGLLSVSSTLNRAKKNTGASIVGLQMPFNKCIRLKKAETHKKLSLRSHFVYRSSKQHFKQTESFGFFSLSQICISKTVRLRMANTIFVNRVPL